MGSLAATVEPLLLTAGLNCFQVTPVNPSVSGKYCSLVRRLRENRVNRRSDRRSCRSGLPGQNLWWTSYRCALRLLDLSIFAVIKPHGFARSLSHQPKTQWGLLYGAPLFSEVPRHRVALAHFTVVQRKQINSTHCDALGIRTVRRPDRTPHTVP